MDVTRCMASVSDGFWVSQCSRKAKRDGYCGQHHPDAQDARVAKRNARWAEEDKIAALRSRQHERKQQLMDALADAMLERDLLPSALVRAWERWKEVADA